MGIGFYSFFLSQFLFYTLVHAQIDPSSALLLRGGGRPTNQDQLDSERYVKKPSGRRPTEAAEVDKTHQDDPQENGKKKSPNHQGSENKMSENKTPSLHDSRGSGTNLSGLSPEQTAQVQEDALAKPTVTDQMQQLFLGGTPTQIDQYRKKMRPEDPGQNILEVSLAPAMMLTSAHSSYWFHHYSSFSPGYVVGSQVWITPFFGLNFNFIESLDASISGEASRHDQIAFEQSWLDIGFHWRKFFGSYKKAPVLNFGLDYSEMNSKVPSDSTQRIKTKTLGLKISLEVTLPKSQDFAWQWGGFLIPKAEHRELSTQLDLSSGDKNNSTVVGLWWGGVHTLDRHQQLFWKFQQSLEKNLFEGTASQPDPVSGETPRGVSVQTGVSLFIFGFKWGS